MKCWKSKTAASSSRGRKRSSWQRWSRGTSLGASTNLHKTSYTASWSTSCINIIFAFWTLLWPRRCVELVLGRRWSAGWWKNWVSSGGDAFLKQNFGKQIWQGSCFWVDQAGGRWRCWRSTMTRRTRMQFCSGTRCRLTRCRRQLMAVIGSVSATIHEQRIWTPVLGSMNANCNWFWRNINSRRGVVAWIRWSLLGWRAPCCLRDSETRHGRQSRNHQRLDGIARDQPSRVFHRSWKQNRLHGKTRIEGRHLDWWRSAKVCPWALSSSGLVFRCWVVFGLDISARPGTITTPSSALNNLTDCTGLRLPRNRCVVGLRGWPKRKRSGIARATFLGLCKLPPESLAF